MIFVLHDLNFSVTGFNPADYGAIIEIYLQNSKSLSQ